VGEVYRVRESRLGRRLVVDLIGSPLGEPINPDGIVKVLDFKPMNIGGTPAANGEDLCPSV
jgi:hypothetical protein